MHEYLISFTRVDYIKTYVQNLRIQITRVSRAYFFWKIK
jgi:hypothetical protein